jgi:endonuclease YncB( thermonuclease family)
LGRFAKSLILGLGVAIARNPSVCLRQLCVALLACVPTVAAAHAQGCHFTPIGAATVRAVTDDAIVLEDGRAVRLAGITDVAQPNVSAALPAGRSIALKRLGIAETDRYGRIAAHIFVIENDAERWLQADLVARGLARASSRIGDVACAKELLAREDKARGAKLGLWSEPYYVIAKAEEPGEVLTRRGRFALVEGKVLSVRESGGTIYVNFGRRWSEDFTVTIAKRNERVFAAAGLAPKTLAGRTVRVRGWIEERGGPWVEASRPEQIEVLERN